MAVPSATSAMISEINSRELYRPTKGRKLTGDLERFDWWEQFQRYTPAALAAAQLPEKFTGRIKNEILCNTIINRYPCLCAWLVHAR